MHQLPFVAVITDHAGDCCSYTQAILERFSGNRLLWIELLKQKSRSVIFEDFIVGRGHHGADDVQLYRRKMHGDSHVHRVMWLFRERMYERYDIESGQLRRSSMDLRTDNASVNIAVIANKRPDIDSQGIYRDLLKVKNTFAANITITHIEWSGPNSYKDFGRLLNVLRSVDIYISGCGTGMMWFPMVASGAVIVNLGDVIKFPSGRDVLYYLHEMDHMMVSYVRVIYYPTRQRWSGVNSSEVVVLTRKAINLLQSNFNIPVDGSTNLHVAGREFNRMCETILPDSSCLRLLSLMGGLPIGECAYAGRYPYYVLWGENGWKESGECALSVPLNESLRIEIQNTLLSENLSRVV